MAIISASPSERQQRANICVCMCPGIFLFVVFGFIYLFFRFLLSVIYVILLFSYFFFFRHRFFFFFLVLPVCFPQTLKLSSFFGLVSLPVMACVCRACVYLSVCGELSLPCRGSASPWFSVMYHPELQHKGLSLLLHPPSLGPLIHYLPPSVPFSLSLSILISSLESPN